MKKRRFSDEQIIGMIKEQEAGMPTADVCRKRRSTSTKLNLVGCAARQTIRSMAESGPL